MLIIFFKPHDTHEYVHLTESTKMNTFTVFYTLNFSFKFVLLVLTVNKQLSRIKYFARCSLHEVEPLTVRAKMNTIFSLEFWLWLDIWPGAGIQIVPLFLNRSSHNLQNKSQSYYKGMSLCERISNRSIQFAHHPEIRKKGLFPASLGPPFLHL